MATPRILSDLYGTLQSLFRFGTVSVSDTGGIVAAKNKAGSTYVPVAASAINLQGSTSGVSGFVAPAVAGQQWVLPGTDGTVGQQLSTNGAGVLAWASNPTDKVGSKDYTIVFGSPTTTAEFTPPANALITNVTIIVDTPFTGGTGATLQVGVTGTIAKYAAAADSDLTFAAEYEKEPNVQETVPLPVIVTYTPNGATAGSARVIIDYVVPV